MLHLKKHRVNKRRDEKSCIVSSRIQTQKNNLKELVSLSRSQNPKDTDQETAVPLIGSNEPLDSNDLVEDILNTLPDLDLIAGLTNSSE